MLDLFGPPLDASLYLTVIRCVLERARGLPQVPSALSLQRLFYLLLAGDEHASLRDIVANSKLKTLTVFLSFLHSMAGMCDAG